jgi:hypothetical protein
VLCIACKKSPNNERLYQPLPSPVVVTSHHMVALRAHPCVLGRSVQLADAAVHLTSLTHLDLHHNHLGDTGVRILAMPLTSPASRHLLFLDVSDNGLPGADDDAFSDVLRSLAVPLRDPQSATSKVGLLFFRGHVPVSLQRIPVCGVCVLPIGTQCVCGVSFVAICVQHTNGQCPILECDFVANVAHTFVCTCRHHV